MKAVCATHYALGTGCFFISGENGYFAPKTQVSNIQGSPLFIGSISLSKRFESTKPKGRFHKLKQKNTQDPHHNERQYPHGTGVYTLAVFDGENLAPWPVHPRRQLQNRQIMAVAGLVRRGGNRRQVVGLHRHTGRCLVPHTER